MKGKAKTKKHKRSSRNQLRRYGRNVLSISAIILLVSVVVLFAGVSLQQRNEEYIAIEKELQEQIAVETARSEEIDELTKYVGTDEYIEFVAKEKLGLVYKGEILFRAE